VPIAELSIADCASAQSAIRQWAIAIGNRQ
jgi:hypothetical protein